MLKLTFIDPEGTHHEVEAPGGITVLEVARRNGINIEGACEGSLSCSTCHVIVDSRVYGRLAAPDGSPARSLWVIINAPWYYPDGARPWPGPALPCRFPEIDWQAGNRPGAQRRSGFRLAPASWFLPGQASRQSERSR